MRTAIASTSTSSVDGSHGSSRRPRTSTASEPAPTASVAPWDVARLAEHVPQLREEVALAGPHAEQTRQLRKRDHHAEPEQEPGHDRLGHEVRDSAEAQQAGERQHDRHHERERRRQRGEARGIAAGHRPDGRRRHRRRRGGRAHHELRDVPSSA
jgi:hypothetical protein